MPKVTLKHPPCMSSEEVENAPSSGKGRFWVAAAEANAPALIHHFIDIGFHRADSALQINLDIPYGRYILGCGYGRNVLRRPFEVTLLGVKF